MDKQLYLKMKKSFCETIEVLVRKKKIQYKIL